MILNEDQKELLLHLIAYFNEWDHPLMIDMSYVKEKLETILEIGEI
jgi:hypothetical protein